MASSSSSSDDLADHDLLQKLTMRPLRALCSSHGVDHGLAGKPKAVLVNRLLKLRQLTRREIEPHLPGAAGLGRRTAGVSKTAGVAKSNATKREKLEQYFAGGGRALKCSRCSQPLRTIRELKAPHGSHTFISVSCGRYPQCKANHKLNDAYLDYCRLQCPRLVFEAHSLRGILEASHDAFSLSVDASNDAACALIDELLRTRVGATSGAGGSGGGGGGGASGGGASGQQLGGLALSPTTEDERALVAGSGARRGALFAFAQYHTVHAAAVQLRSSQRSQHTGGGQSAGATDDPFKLTGLPELKEQLSLFLHAAGVPTTTAAASADGAAAASTDGAASSSVDEAAAAASGSTGTTATAGADGADGADGAPSHVALMGEDTSRADAGEARLRACGLWHKLRPYQREGVTRALKFGGTALLGDEMGLGKTLTALATVAALDAWPCLAIVPAVTRRGWACEVEQWLVGVLAPSDIHVVYDQVRTAPRSHAGTHDSIHSGLLPHVSLTKASVRAIHPPPPMCVPSTHPVSMMRSSRPARCQSS